MAEELFVLPNTALTLAHDMHFYVSVHKCIVYFLRSNTKNRVLSSVREE